MRSSTLPGPLPTNCLTVVLTATDVGPSGVKEIHYSVNRGCRCRPVPPSRSASRSRAPASRASSTTRSTTPATPSRPTRLSTTRERLHLGRQRRWDRRQLLPVSLGSLSPALPARRVERGAVVPAGGHPHRERHPTRRARRPAVAGTVDRFVAGVTTRGHDGCASLSGLDVPAGYGFQDSAAADACPPALLASKPRGSAR